MLNILKKICKKHQFASVYTDANDTSKFMFGKIIYIDENYFVMYLISPDGEYDGIILKNIIDVIRIEVDDLYFHKMDKLINPQNLPNICISFGKEAVGSLLHFAHTQHNIISIELLNSGYNDAVGMVNSFSEDICVLEQFDIYGCADGKSYIRTEDITQITIDSQEEHRISRLINQSNQ